VANLGGVLSSGAWLVLPLAFYLVPLLAGYGWTMFGPGTPRMPYDAGPTRLPDAQITVEGFGTSVVVVPLLARMRRYLLAGEPPLWNPYQGLGQPFAAQGDGSPYFPLAMVRALLPYDDGAYVTVLSFFLGGLFTVLLLRELGLSPAAALAGGAMFEISGALSLHVARFNIADQTCMAPVLLWATARAARRRDAAALAVLALVAGLHAVAGFIQTAMIVGLVALLFGVALVWAEQPAWRARLRGALGLGVATGVGNGLAAFHLLPLVDMIQRSFNVRGGAQGFLQVPQTNGLAFFFPNVFGPYFGSWLYGDLPTVDWNNLYGFAGTGPLLLTLIGVCLVGRAGTRHRFAFCFFAGAGTLLLLRYLVFPPVAGLNLLPILGHQTPKHANGLMALCFVVAAAAALDMLRLAPARRLRPWIALLLLGVVSFVVTVVWQHGGTPDVSPVRARVYLGYTATLVVGLLVACWGARRWPGLHAPDAARLVGCVVVGELASYVPLGTDERDVVFARALLFAGIVAGALLLALGRCRVGAPGAGHPRLGHAGTGALGPGDPGTSRLEAGHARTGYPWARHLGLGLFGLVAVGYAAVVVLPADGLPTRVDALAPPRFLRWLADEAGAEYRTLGIAPDFSSVGGVQDLGVVGPFSPRSFANFVQAVSPELLWRNFQRIGTFWVTIGFPVREYYDLGAYMRAKPVFDWLGVRYVVLDREFFRADRRLDHLPLVSGAAGLRVAYEDAHVTVVESPSAAPKAEYWTGVRTLPDAAQIVRALGDDPALALGPPLLVQSPALERLGLAVVERDATDDVIRSVGPLPATVDLYGPNRVLLTVDAPGPGLLVLKDAVAPGWRAWVDGTERDIVEVHAMVRGVPVLSAGRHSVELAYRPGALLLGLAISGACSLVVVALVARAALGHRRLSTAGRWRIVASARVDALARTWPGVARIRMGMARARMGRGRMGRLA